MTAPHADRRVEDAEPEALSLPGDLAHYRNVIAEVDRRLRAQGWTDARYTRHARSSQAVIVRVTVRRGGCLERCALKIFTRDVDLGAREYANLVSFWRSLRKRAAPVHCPMPILGGDGYYLMSYIDAPTLVEWLAYGPPAKRERVAALIVFGLQAYHDATSEVYGELHPLHILVQEDESLCFIDCTIPHHHFDEMHLQAYPLLARDIGYWLHATMSLGLRRILDPSMRALTLLRFTRVLIDQAASRSLGTRAEFVGEVLAVLRALRTQSAHGPRLRIWAVLLLSRLIINGPRSGVRW